MKVKLKMGLSFESVVEMLGPPTASNDGSRLAGGKGVIIGMSTNTRAKLFHTQYCLWRRPEGEYSLIFEYGRLTDISTHPEDLVERPRPALFLLVITDHEVKYGDQLATSLIKKLAIQVSENAIIIVRCSPATVAAQTDESRFGFIYSTALMAFRNAGISHDQLDVEALEIYEFKTGLPVEVTGIVAAIPEVQKGVRSG